MLDMRVRSGHDLDYTRCLTPYQDSSSRFPSLASRARDIYTTEGFRGLLSGIVPRTLWVSAGGAIFLGVYELVVGALVGS